MQKILILSAIIVITWGLVATNGIRATYANNLWLISFIKAHNADANTL